MTCGDHCDCGCCRGLTASTPASVQNRPGLTALDYRVGTYSDFRASLLARLSGVDYPALAGLRTRDTRDPAIAVLEGFAVVADVLTFYQERIANECFVRTATELRSLTELSRLIGYRPKPGVAAATYLAFRLQEAPGAPQQAAAPVTVPVGTKVQSVPGPNETPQIFETVDAVTARVTWNAIPVQSTEEQAIRLGMRELYLDGTSAPLDPGDVLLIVGRERRRFHGSERWDVRVVRTVERDDNAKRTRVTWEPLLGHERPRVEPADPPVEVFVFRQRAALFGHNAPDPRILKTNAQPLTGLVDANLNWVAHSIDTVNWTVDLDADYPKIVPGSWLALVKGNPEAATARGYVELYGAEEVHHLSRSDFALSSGITRVKTDTAENLGRFLRQDTLVLAQSERLAISQRPIRYPLYGATLTLARLEPELDKGRHIAVSGKRQRLRIAEGVSGLRFVRDDLGPVNINGGDLFQVSGTVLEIQSGNQSNALSPTELGDALYPPLVEQGDGTLAPPPARMVRWNLTDRDGGGGTLDAKTDQVVLQAASPDDATISEIAMIAQASHDRDPTTLTLEQALTNCYDRATVTINANVALATHGETVEEVLGSGDAAARDQAFVLKQAPLTWVSAATPSGRLTTLEVRVNGLRWHEVPTLFQQAGREREYVTRQDAQTVTTVQFGDGAEGARLPTGSANVRAKYRKGIGLAGNVAAARLTTLLSRPLGVQEVTNPAAATGGEDPESLGDIRSNAPLGVLTLDRAVSVLDYQDFARGFAGIAKAHAMWIPHGPARGVFLTIAGHGGSSLPPDSPHRQNLARALRQQGDPLLPIRIDSFRSATFGLQGSIKVDPDALVDVVLDACRAEVKSRFAFDARDFGQGVALDEILAVLQNVAGVVAADIDALYVVGTSQTWNARLAAPLPDPSAPEGVSAAVILTIDPRRVALEAMA